MDDGERTAGGIPAHAIRHDSGGRGIGGHTGAGGCVGPWAQSGTTLAGETGIRRGNQAVLRTGRPDQPTRPAPSLPEAA